MYLNCVEVYLKVICVYSELFYQFISETASRIYIKKILLNVEKKYLGQFHTIFTPLISSFDEQNIENGEIYDRYYDRAEKNF